MRAGSWPALERWAAIRSQDMPTLPRPCLHAAHSSKLDPEAHLVSGSYSCTVGLLAVAHVLRST